MPKAASSSADSRAEWGSGRSTARFPLLGRSVAGVVPAAQRLTSAQLTALGRAHDPAGDASQVAACVVAAVQDGDTDTAMVQLARLHGNPRHAAYWVKTVDCPSEEGKTRVRHRFWSAKKRRPGR